MEFREVLVDQLVAPLGVFQADRGGRVVDDRLEPRFGRGRSFFGCFERQSRVVPTVNVTPVDVDVGLASDRCDREGEDAIAAFELGLLDLGGA
jgi:hypothetical protein